jgi:hypothetical protein
MQDYVFKALQLSRDQKYKELLAAKNAASDAVKALNKDAPEFKAADEALKAATKALDKFIDSKVAPVQKALLARMEERLVATHLVAGVLTPKGLKDFCGTHPVALQWIEKRLGQQALGNVNEQIASVASSSQSHSMM